jgi:hypothetical protein
LDGFGIIVLAGPGLTIHSQSPVFAFCCCTFDFVAKTLRILGWRIHGWQALVDLCTFCLDELDLCSLGTPDWYRKKLGYGDGAPKGLPCCIIVGCLEKESKKENDNDDDDASEQQTKTGSRMCTMHSLLR